MPSSAGISFPIVHCITQDAHGFIWITSPYGLARYDGNEYLLFHHLEGDQTSLIDDYLFSVLEDSRGNLWITSDKGLDLFDRKTGHFIHYQHDPNDPLTLSSNRIRAIEEDRDGNIWIGTTDAGICHFDYNTKKFTRFIHDPSNHSSPSSHSIWAICCDREGRIWIGTHEGELDCFNPETGLWHHYNLLPENPDMTDDPNIWDLCEGRDGRIWVGTSNIGLISLDPDSGKIGRVHLKGEKGDSGDYKILSIHQDQDGLIWLGTEEAGLFSYNPGNSFLKHYVGDSNTQNGLSDNSVITIFEDREGLLWFGTNKGIYLLNKKRLRFPLMKSDAQIPGGLADDNILSIYEDREKIVWISTARGGLSCWDRVSNRWNQSAIPNKWLEYFVGVPVRAICEDHQGNLWFGTSNGLVCYERQKNNCIAIQSSKKNQIKLPAYNITAITQSREGYLWIGTYNGGLYEWDTINKRAYPVSIYKNNEGSNIYIINTLYVDRRGVLWIGTQWHGVDFLDIQNNRFIHYRNNPDDPNSLPSSTVYSIVEDKNGKIWAGTEAGPCQFDSQEQQWRPLANEIALPDTSAYSLLFDESNNLWMGTNRGLIQVIEQPLMWRKFGPEDGIQGNFFNPGVCFKTREGELFFGGASGINNFFPDQVYINSNPPQIFITSYKLSTQSRELALFEKINELKITKKDLPVTIKMAALSFTFPANNHYKVLVVNENPNLILLNTQNSIYLDSIRRGKNRLLIFGSNNDQIWNPDGVPLTIILSTPFYQSWFFVISLIIVFTSISWIFYRQQSRKRKRKFLNYIHLDLSLLFKQLELTKREQQVVMLVLEGKSNKEIENELYISQKTVKAHLYNIYKKLNVKNRLQLMNFVRDRFKEQ